MVQSQSSTSHDHSFTEKYSPDAIYKLSIHFIPFHSPTVTHKRRHTPYTISPLYHNPGAPTSPPLWDMSLVAIGGGGLFETSNSSS